MYKVILAVMFAISFAVKADVTNCDAGETNKLYMLQNEILNVIRNTNRETKESVGFISLENHIVIEVVMLDVSAIACNDARSLETSLRKMLLVRSFQQSARNRVDRHCY